MRQEWGLPVLRSGRNVSHNCDVCVVGSSTVFTGGLSYFTYFLTKELSGRSRTSSLLMRRLVPRWLYPGGHRVGAAVTDLHTSQLVPAYDGVDWFGIPSVPRAVRFLRQQRPRVLLLQWWSGSMLPWYLIFAWWARRNDTSVVLELHEDQDPSEAELFLIGPLVRALFRLLRNRSDAYIVHSEWDRERMARSLGLSSDRTFVIPHGPYPLSRAQAPAARPARRPGDPVTLLMFGLIRPYKGIMNLLMAFDRLPRDEGRPWKLLVVGDTWAGWTEPLERIATANYRDDIEVVNRFVADEEIPGYFERCDIVMLPYLRSSASGPLQLAMSAGLPIVVSDVGGLGERAAAYSGSVLVPAGDTEALIEGILEARELVGTTHDEPDSWKSIGDMYENAFADLLAGRPPAGPPPVGRRPTSDMSGSASQP